MATETWSAHVRRWSKREVAEIALSWQGKAKLREENVRHKPEEKGT